jgi:hypothetical protein
MDPTDPGGDAAPERPAGHAMLRFAVFDDDGAAPSWPLRAATVIGHDGIALPGAVRFEAGCVVCEPGAPEPAAFAIQWDAGDLGELTLQTCMLPQRDRAYLLSLELARHRIMLFLTKLEEWSRTEIDPGAPEMTVFAEAHTTFMDALALDRTEDGDYTIEHDRIARRALALAVDAGEKLAESTAEASLARRLSVCGEGGVPIPAVLGCAVAPDRFTDGLARVVSDTFDFLCVPTRWAMLEPEEGEYRFTPTDRWIEWAVRKAKIPVTAGPIVDLGPDAAPDWVYIWENDYETLRDLIYEHLKRVITRYRRAVSKWTVASGLHLNSNFALTVEEIVDLTRLSVLVARKLHPTAKVQVEIDLPFGESTAISERAVSPILYAEILGAAGVQVDSFGLRIQMGDAAPGHTARDLMQISALLDHYAVFERPISVSVLGAPSEPQQAVAEMESGADGPSHSVPGRWRGPWDEARQADWATRVINIALSKQFVTSVAWQSLYDTPDGHPMPTGGLITQGGHPKAALARLAQVKRALHEKRALSGLVTGAGATA